MARLVIRNALFFGSGKMSSLLIPWVTYTDPEVAHVGLYEVRRHYDFQDLDIQCCEKDRGRLSTMQDSEVLTDELCCSLRTDYCTLLRCQSQARKREHESFSKSGQTKCSSSQESLKPQASKNRLFFVSITSKANQEVQQTMLPSWCIYADRNTIQL